ncbi:MAG: RNA 2',3'-cyclic phosphodiesterase [Archaeoglobaceae archaeon]
MRLFIAADLDPEIREKLVPVQQVLDRSGVKTVKKDNVHITLKFLGEVEDSRVEPIKEALRKIEFKSFDFHVKGVGFFPSPNHIKVAWVGVEEGNDEMSDLAKQIDDKMKKLGFKKEKKKFIAHATLARIKKINAQEREKMLKDLEPYLNQDFGWMNVSNFTLKKSELTPKGPIYSDIEVFELE